FLHILRVFPFQLTLVKSHPQNYPTNNQAHLSRQLMSLDDQNVARNQHGNDVFPANVYTQQCLENTMDDFGTPIYCAALLKQYPYLLTMWQYCLFHQTQQQISRQRKG